MKGEIAPLELPAGPVVNLVTTLKVCWCETPGSVPSADKGLIRETCRPTEQVTEVFNFHSIEKNSMLKNNVLKY